MKQVKLLLFACLLVSLAAAAVAEVVPLASGGGFLRVEAGGDAENVFPVISADTTTVMLDAELESTDGSGSRSGLSLANLNVVYGTSVFVDTQVATRQLNRASQTRASVQATATGTLNFNSRMFFQTAPPFISDRYPVLLFMPYSMSDFGTPDSTATVTMRILENEIKVFDETRSLFEDEPEGQFVVPGLLQPDDIFEIQIEATAFATAWDLERGVTKFSEAQAIIGQSTFSFPEPERPEQPAAQSLLDANDIATEFTVMFDQAAFDLEHGANSYQLDQFLAFEFSPGVVPEPGSAVLLTLAVGPYLLRRRRR